MVWMSFHAGHYIVVVSYSATKDVYGIRDPASEFASVLVPAAALDAARTSFGTDEVNIPNPNWCRTQTCCFHLRNSITRIEARE